MAKNSAHCWVVREVLKFAWIGRVVVEFFAAAAAVPLDVAVTVGTDGETADVLECDLSVSGVLDTPVGAIQEWDQALAGQAGWRVQMAQFGQCGVDVDELY